MQGPTSVGPCLVNRLAFPTSDVSFIVLRTQISLTEGERHAVDAEAARTGRSVSALIRDAVEALYRSERSSEADLQAMRASFGTWNGRDGDGATWVDRVRSGDRLGQTAS
ncbi:CopG family transcriptional regulator [Cryobacterium sp. Hh7]|nr:CopG family transcriptional regulator [Cryobacterium sp. Hh7]